MPIIIDNFQVNINAPIDNRFVVGGTDSFYSDRDAIKHKYQGLRIWDLTHSGPYYWTGITWSSENAIGVSVDETTSKGYLPVFTQGPTVLGKSLLFQNNNTSQIGIGFTDNTLINPNTDSTGSNIPSNIGGLHTIGNIKTNGYFVGKGDYIKQLNANNISFGLLDITHISNLQSSTSGTPVIPGSYVLFNNGSNNGVTWVPTNTLSVLNSTNATNTTNVFLFSDDTTNTTHYINFTQNYIGYNTLKTSPNKLKYNPSTGTVLSTNVELTGNLKVKDYLSIGQNTLSSTLGSQVSLVKLTTNNGNNDYLDITNTRASVLNPNDWRSAGHRIQQKVDSVYMAYIQFNGNNDGGISFGTGQTNISATSILERFRIDQSGNFFMTGLGSVTSLTGTTTLVRDSTSGQLSGFDLGSALGSALATKVTTTGTLNRYQKITGTNVIGDGYIWDNGTNIVFVDKSLYVNNDLQITSLAGSGTRTIGVDSTGKVVEVLSDIIMTGTIDHNGNKLTFYKKDFSCTKTGTGTYKITHNLGLLNYAIIGGGLTQGTLKVAAHERLLNETTVYVSDDSTLNDGDFSFIIFRIS